MVERQTLPVELRLVTLADRELVRCQFDAYLQELSLHRDIAVGAVDASTYPYFESYWSEPGRYLFIFETDGHPIGLAFIRGPDSTGSGGFQVAEFYIEPSSRRHGIGSIVAAAIWHTFPGQWELQVHARNATGVRFWSACVSSQASEAPIVTEVNADDGRRFQYNFTVVRTA